MERLAEGVRRLRDGAVARAILPGIVRLAESEGILERARRMSPFSFDDLCRALCADLGYSLSLGNRRRMIRTLLDILAECGMARKETRTWEWRRDAPQPVRAPEGGSSARGAEGDPAGDPEILFFNECLRSVPSYLRGGAPTIVFGEGCVGTWERFLGCREFRTCRGLLLDLLGIDDSPSFRLLDLCHGPGFGVEAASRMFPAIRITALDFTDAFTGRAKERLAGVSGENRARGLPAADVTWVGPDRWKGFGAPLPFGDASFDAVFFSCGDPYVPRAIRREVYREIGRVIAEGGRLGVLTRGYPDAEGRHVSSAGVRLAALAHDFAESVCEGWEGFNDPEESIGMFSSLGFREAGNVLGRMSLLESSLWILAKGRTDA